MSCRRTQRACAREQRKLESTKTQNWKCGRTEVESKAQKTTSYIYGNPESKKSYRNRMPKGYPHPNKKQHSKGRVPAHQNKTAFHHNPKSKLTDKILSCPIEGLCRRCHEKIEWRKTYRKYKLRTQPGTCNLCKRRNVLAAYHTICGDCAWDRSTLTTENCSAKSGSSNGASPVTKEEQLELSEEEFDNLPEEEAGSVKDQQPEQEEGPIEEQAKNIPDDKNDETHRLPSHTPRKLRMCAICTKKPALTGKGSLEDEEEDSSTVTGITSLRLRERRTMERKITKEQQEKRRRRRNIGDDEDLEEGEFEDDFDLEDYEDDSQDDVEELGIPVRDAGLA